MTPTRPQGEEPIPESRLEGANRRRSERILLTIPIRVWGLTSKGERFDEQTRTVVINRHGARIQLKHRVATGETIEVENLAAHRRAKFRLIGPTGPVGVEGGEWGVECSEEGANIWGIEFPPASHEELLANALLQCRNCRMEALMAISMVEHDVLTSSGLLMRQCSSCHRVTAWSYADQAKAARAIPTEPPESALAAGRVISNSRIYKRAALQLPVRIRDYYGSEEITKSENVSKSGVCYTSEKDYEIGSGILVTCPYNPGSHNIELRARVVRRQAMSGSIRKIYGVHYEQASSEKA